MKISQIIERRRECEAGKLWWTCDKPAFAGCCSIDPCQPKGCPDSSTATIGASVAITLSPTKTQATTESPTESSSQISLRTQSTASTTLSTTTTSITSKPASLTSDAVSSIASAANSQSAPTHLSESTRTGLLVGLSVLATLLFIGIVLFLLKRRKERRQQSIPSTSQVPILHFDHSAAPSPNLLATPSGISTPSSVSALSPMPPSYGHFEPQKQTFTSAQFAADQAELHPLFELPGSDHRQTLRR